MKRVTAVWTLVTLAGAAQAAPQASAGAELWRLAAVTVPLPPTLATGSLANYWNPAQADSVGQLGLDLIQTPQAIGASGLVAGVRLPAGRLGTIGFLYARMGLGDLIHTTDTPEPDGALIPFYTQRAAITWGRGIGHSTVGAALSLQDTKLDGTTSSRWSLDVGITQRIGERIRLTAATRGLRRIGRDPAQDVSAGIEYQLWRGTLWGAAPGVVFARYGVGGGRPGGLDHLIGLGLNLGALVSLDVVLAREVSYGYAAWRGAAGVRVGVGRYRMSFARDGGISDLGSSYRVGLEASLR
jgi:hypothetical protein